MASTLPPTQPPTAQEYAGDEIGALVLDAGSHSIRAGFAGEDTPKSVIPTHYGVLDDGRQVFGENAIHIARADMDIRTPYTRDGLVEDWDTATRLWEYSITSRLTGAPPTSPRHNGLNEPQEAGADVAMAERADDELDKVLGEYPLLMSEPGGNPVKHREKMVEVLMEDWGVPAFFLEKTGKLAAYANGKATALVVDVGHTHTAVTAVWEGMTLKKSLMTSPIAGAYLSDQLRLMFAQTQPPVPLVPHYMVKAKSPVDANAPANAVYTHFATPPKDSFRRFEEERVLTAFKESVVQCWQGPGRLESNLDPARSYPARPFEMPDGWNTVFGLERFKVVEPFFDTKHAYTSPDLPTPKSEDSVSSLVHRALQNVDVDARPTLLANVILTGAGSLIEKFADRLQADLQALNPNPRVRVIATSNSVERKYGSWIGGSVLASLGTFHQMWVPRHEYKEFGASIVERRCK
ncbi:actin-related protein, ARP4 class [Teratosphaeria nubilosa]|uniref:Actin-related protein, ARP4 class n=1 Tax=Teratosphaeria nubilosa TaxID=161662 RepID=A0A6G1L517_9PEZI|nr:actin-related protein, ARP4 class [Teratosphaeria nubilosa]